VQTISQQNNCRTTLVTDDGDCTGTVSFSVLAFFGD